MPQIHKKDPDATKDYQINWATWLGTDTIGTSTWTVPTGITKVTDTNTTTTTTIWLSGGTNLIDYELTNKIVSANGRTEEDTIVVKVRQTTTATGDYCSLMEIKERLWPPGANTDSVSDLMLGNIITAVSRQVDNFCERRFYTTAADETRYFTTEDTEYLFPDLDVISVTSIAVDYDGGRAYSNTLATTDYDLLPDNAALDSKPYSYIRIAPLGQERFPTHQKGIRIVGKFGWSSVPAGVKEACLIQVERIWKRKDSPFGIISNPVGGDMRLLDKLDPDVQVLLWNYRKWV